MSVPCVSLAPADQSSREYYQICVGVCVCVTKCDQI